MNGLYASARQKLLTAELVWTAAPVFVLLVSADYVPNFETDATMANVPAGAVLTPPVALAGLTAIGGYAGAASVSFGALTTAKAIAAILLKLQPAAAVSTDPLLMYLNQGAGFGAKPVNTQTLIAWNNSGVWRP